MPNENQGQPPVNKIGLDELRIKVAELCGWTKCDYNTFKSDHLFHKKGEGFRLRWSLPDFPSDLNAIHEAVVSAITTNALFIKYRDHLKRIAGHTEPILATATDHCLALVATMEDKT